MCTQPRSILCISPFSNRTDLTDGIPDSVHDRRVSLQPEAICNLKMEAILVLYLPVTIAHVSPRVIQPQLMFLELHFSPSLNVALSP